MNSLIKEKLEEVLWNWHSSTVLYQMNYLKVQIDNRRIC